MNVKEYLKLLDLAENLKNNTRHSWTSSGRRESVAEHSWRLCFMAYFVKDEFPDTDMDKVLKMCLFHDFGEAFTGDIPTFEKRGEDEQEEARQIRRWLAKLPGPYREELTELFREMDAQETPEAKLYKALDKLEAVIQHNEADLSTWLPLEYALQLTYGKEQVQFSEYLKELKAAIDQVTEDKIRGDAPRGKAGAENTEE